MSVEQEEGAHRETPEGGVWSHLSCVWTCLPHIAFPFQNKEEGTHAHAHKSDEKEQLSETSRDSSCVLEE